MATIVLPAGNAQVNGTVSDPVKFRDSLYDALNPATSLAERNGLLDEDNLSENLDYRSFRLGSASLGGTVFTPRTWEFYRPSGFPAPATAQWRYVPGFGARIFLPWTARVLLSWSCTYRSDLEYTADADPTWQLRLFLNDVQQNQHTTLPQWTDGTAAGADESARRWTGFRVVDTLAGEQWHDFGIKMRCEEEPLLMRLYRSSFTWLALKQS